jgi:hypothetical protein
MQVDDTLFRVNECMFDQGSEKAARLLARKAERPDGVILLEDATATDFERFLSAVYCKYVERHGHVMRVDDLFPRISDDPPLSTEDDWASVLKLSHRFGFKSMHRLAAKHLLPLTSYIDRVVLAHAYEIDSWLPQAYMDVCELALLPSPADAHRLGFDVFIKIATARQQIYSVSGCVNLSERSKIIKNLFGSPSTPASVKGADISVSFEEAVEVPHPTESPPPRAPVRASSPPVETQSSPPTDQAAPAAPPALASTGQIDASGSATLETLSASSAPPPVDAATPKPAEKGKAAERGPSSSSDRSKDAQVNRRVSSTTAITTPLHKPDIPRPSTETAPAPVVTAKSKMALAATKPTSSSSVGEKIPSTVSSTSSSRRPASSASRTVNSNPTSSGLWGSLSQARATVPSPSPRPFRSRLDDDE